MDDVNSAESADMYDEFYTVAPLVFLSSYTVFIRSDSIYSVRMDLSESSKLSVLVFRNLTFDQAFI